jgi:hypothetical protein
MTKYLMWLATRNQDGGEGEGGQAPVPLTDWNLDADRGYGYHCWDWNRRSDSEEFPPVADPERNDFLQPCTWPSQTSGHDYDPAVPLQLHWAGPGLEDRGCQDPECIDCAPVIG